MVVLTAAVEGLVDEAVVRRLAKHVGVEVGPVYGKNGKGHLRQRIAGYNNAARISPWVVLVDLNREAECAPPLRDAWLEAVEDRLLRFQEQYEQLAAWFQSKFTRWDLLALLARLERQSALLPLAA